MELNAVSRKYKIGKQISKGSFGIMRLGRNLKTNDCVAIKLELKKAKEPTLHLEYRFYKILGENPSLPKVFYFGACDVYNALVLQLLGPTLRDCFELCGGRFPLKTVTKIAIQIISALEYIHSKRIIHRDLKPENFAIGRDDDPKRDTLRLFDFGLAKEYIDDRGNHIPMKSNKTIIGTARFISIWCHQQLELSRRDDLESIGYILIYLLEGSLPWQQSNSNIRDKYSLIGNIKQNTTLDELCKGVPAEFLNFMKHVKSLEFNGTPNYEYLRTLFNDLSKRNNYGKDDVYEWTLVMHKKDVELQKKSDTRRDTRQLKEKNGKH